MTNQPQSLKERQQALRDRRQKLGLVRVEVWVPKHCAHEVKSYAKALTIGETR